MRVALVLSSTQRRCHKRRGGEVGTDGDREVSSWRSIKLDWSARSVPFNGLREQYGVRSNELMMPNVEMNRTLHTETLEILLMYG